MNIHASRRQPRLPDTYAILVIRNHNQWQTERIVNAAVKDRHLQLHKPFPRVLSCSSHRVYCHLIYEGVCMKIAITAFHLARSAQENDVRAE